MYFECYNVPSDYADFHIASIYAEGARLFALYKNDSETRVKAFDTLAGKTGLLTEVQAELRKLLRRGVLPSAAEAIQENINKMELYLHPELAEQD